MWILKRHLFTHLHIVLLLSSKALTCKQKEKYVRLKVVGKKNAVFYSVHGSEPMRLTYNGTEDYHFSWYETDVILLKIFHKVTGMQKIFKPSYERDFIWKIPIVCLVFKLLFTRSVNICSIVVVFAENHNITRINRIYSISAMKRSGPAWNQSTRIVKCIRPTADLMSYFLRIYSRSGSL